MISAGYCLGKLPPFRNRSLLIEKKQSVHDIISEVLSAHKIFCEDYDAIGVDFWAGSVGDTARELWRFCKRSIEYRIESENYQTTKSPAAILTAGVGDCKHYAGFIGGVLDAIRRAGRRVNWSYRFASYSWISNLPEHVFVVVKDTGGEIWIDPVLKSFDDRSVPPSGWIDKKSNVETMALTRISGMNEISFPVNDVGDNVDPFIDPEILQSVELLLKYGILNDRAQVNDSAIEQYRSDPDLYNKLIEARSVVGANAIGDLFSDIWRGIKKVLLAPMRGAYLSLVALNVFGYASKLKRAVWDEAGNYTTVKERIKDLWQNKFGGDWARLESTIKNGATKPAVLGGVPDNAIGVVEATIPAWVTIAAAIIAAIMPLVNAFLRSQQQSGSINYDPMIDPATGLPYGSPLAEQGGAQDILTWVQENPAIVIGGAAAIYFLMKRA